MTFQLNISGTPSDTVDGNAIAAALAAFDADQYVDNFIVLSAEAAIDGSIYLQSALISEPDEAKRYVVETRIVESDTLFRHYAYETDDLTAVEQIFSDYFQHQQLPDLTNWQDITDQFA